MLEEQKYSKRIEPYRLDIKRENLECRYWRIKGIYLSEISLVIYVVPQNPWEGLAAKEELRSLLYELGQLALENNLLRPVACVVQADPEPLPDWWNGNELERWGAEQDWHRGAFTLYVEKYGDKDALSPLLERLTDLLYPQLLVFDYERPEEQTWKELMTAIQENFNKDTATNSFVQEQGQRLLDRLETLDPINEGDEQVKELLENWKNEKGAESGPAGNAL